MSEIKKEIQPKLKLLIVKILGVIKDLKDDKKLIENVGKFRKNNFSNDPIFDQSNENPLKNFLDEILEIENQAENSNLEKNILEKIKFIKESLKNLEKIFSNFDFEPGFYNKFIEIKETCFKFEYRFLKLSKILG